MKLIDVIETFPQEMLNLLKEHIQMRERPDYHPEPSALHHILIVTHRACRMESVPLICAGILHDLGKFTTMKINEKTGWPTSPGHDAWGARYARTQGRDWIIQMGADPETVALICEDHMRLHQLPEMRIAKQNAFKEKHVKAGTWSLLTMFGKLDDMLSIPDMDAMAVEVQPVVDFIISK